MSGGPLLCPEPDRQITSVGGKFQTAYEIEFSEGILQSRSHAKILSFAIFYHMFLGLSDSYLYYHVTLSKIETPLCMGS
jgi:hypothetical protein